MPLIGRAGRRNNTNTPNVQETENKSSENETKQRVKGNKRKVAFDLDEAETKVNVRNRKKIVVEEDEKYYPEDESVRPTRGKAVLQEDDLNHTPTKVTRGRKMLTQPKDDAEE
ncbi:hypothetical protein NQ315_010805 [Exocentrus adspersus]|uniref:Uncharacterized protein n=1 Tax=Exocentrus adspersus TaxID=1586481 RepID=A0AAV8V9F9_9CUCU|nr:hypothetical protein NQ315_010805 [Exocentrus adspersus]